MVTNSAARIRSSLITFNTNITHFGDAPAASRGICCNRSDVGKDSNSHASTTWARPAGHTHPARRQGTRDASHLAAWRLEGFGELSEHRRRSVAPKEGKEPAQGARPLPGALAASRAGDGALVARARSESCPQQPPLCPPRRPPHPR